MFLDDITSAALDGIDDFVLWVQRLFCRHCPLVLSERVICKKCGKDLSYQILGGKKNAKS